MQPPRTLVLLSLILFSALSSVFAAPQQDAPIVAQNMPAIARPAGEKTDSEKEVRSSNPNSSLVTRVGVQTGTPLPLSLRDAIRRALEANNDIEVSRGDVRFAETQVEALRGIYDPVFSITPTYSRNSTTGGSATNDFRANADLSKFITRGGGNYRAFFNNTRTENAFAQAQVTSGSVTSGGGVNAIYSSQLGFQYTQPLWRNFRTDNTRRQINIARRRLEQSDTDFRLQATNTITEVQRAYWDFVFALRNQQNQVANVNFARENMRQVEARIDAGAAAPLERAEVATELANRESDLLLATQQVSINENNLKRLLLRDPLSAEWSMSFVPTETPAVDPAAIGMDQALRDAMDNRWELRRLRLQREINEEDVRYFRNQTKPQIDLNTTFSLNGLSRGGANTSDLTVFQFTGNEEILRQRLNTLLSPANQIANPSLTVPGTPSFLSGGFNRSLVNIFRTDAPNITVGVTISFPFRNRTARANLAGALIQQEQLAAQTRGQEQAIIAEVRNAVQAIDTARQRVLTARRARENAEIQLEGERKLLEVGRSTTFLLFQRENQLTNARNAEIRAETDYNKAVADLQRVTSTAFRAHNINVTSPVPNIR
jgi:outer membrane protein TolC